jgi:hypothetical protein
VLDSAGDGDSPTDATTVHDLGGVLASARLLSPAVQVLLDWLGAHIALQSHLDYDGIVGWEHRSVYELVAAHGRWFTPAALPAHIRPLPERQCFANAAAIEREHPHLGYVEGFAVAAGSPVPAAHAWCAAEDGRVVDPTWSDLGGGSYLGMVLPPNLRPRAPRSWGVREARETLYPLLRNGL